jgi:hypothetical protein
MVVSLQTTTSRRSPPFTWSSACVVVCRSSSRPSLARRLVFSQLAAPPTSFPLEEPSHDKSPPHTTSLRLARQVRLRLVRGSRRTARTSPPTRVEENVTQEQQLAAMKAAYPDKSLNAGLIGCTTITSPSSPTLPHARLNPRHRSTLYGVHKPILRLGRGKLGKHSGRLRRAQTTRGEGQASRSKRSNPATRRHPRQGIATWLQCTLTDSDVRRDMPAAKYCNSFLLPLVPLPL